MNQLATLQAAVEDSKTDHQRKTGLKERALFLGTEAGEVQKEVLKLLGNYGPEKAANANADLAKEICDLIWNALDLANMTGIELDEPMRAMLAVNKTRVWVPKP
jgi:NTP pyrophosphatase (non-canonical NTP hydrolase)